MYLCVCKYVQYTTRIALFSKDCFFSGHSSAQKNEYQSGVFSSNQLSVCYHAILQYYSIGKDGKIRIGNVLKSADVGTLFSRRNSENTSHTHAYPRTPVHTRAHPRTPAHTHAHPCTLAHTCAHPCTPSHTCTHPHRPMHTLMHTPAQSRIPPHTHAYPCTPAHPRTLSHTPHIPTDVR